MFNWEIGVGDILLIMSIIGGGGIFLIQIRHELSTLRVAHEKEHLENLKKFQEIEDQLKELIDVTTQVAIQKEKIYSLEDRYNKLDDLIMTTLTKLAKTPTRARAKSNKRI